MLVRVDSPAMSICFVNNAKLLRDACDWATRLPRYDAYVGVPRGGVFIAAAMACQRNSKLLSLEHLVGNRSWSLCIPPIHVANQQPSEVSGGHILVVDDNAGPASATLRRVRELVGKTDPVRVDYGVLYRTVKSLAIDYWFETTPVGPVFEYDWHRRGYVQHAGVDLDGVLCEDYAFPEKEGNDPEHDHHLQNARCLIVPRDPIKAIVTGRLEKHRAATEAWLARHKIRYCELIMYPGNSADQRRWEGTPWQHKAKFLARDDVWFFVESCPRQSGQIHRATSKPVICTHTGQCYQHDVAS